MNKGIGPYRILEVIGSGQYGKVHKGINSDTQEIVAIKIISLVKFEEVPKLCEFILNETSSLQKIVHENVISLKDSLQTTNNLYLVYEFCEGGTLEDVIKAHGILNENQALFYFSQIVKAFGVLFDQKILHRDLKPSNILFQGNILKVADFGFCKPMVNERDLTQTMVGSPIYMAPEILKGEKYSIQADIWSIGIVLFEMLYGNCPYYEYNLYSLLQSITKTKLTFPDHLNQVSISTKNLILRMLTIDPKARITWNELYKFVFANILSRNIEPKPTSKSIANEKRPQEVNFKVNCSAKFAFSRKEKGIRDKPEVSNEKQFSTDLTQKREKIIVLVNVLNRIFHEYQEEFVFPLIFLLLCRLEFENSEIIFDIESQKENKQISKQQFQTLQSENKDIKEFCSKISDQLTLIEIRKGKLGKMNDDMTFIKALFDFLHRILEHSKSSTSNKKWLILSNYISDIALLIKKTTMEEIPSASNLDKDYSDSSTSRLISVLSKKAENIKQIIIN